jgi:hypothetical protein
LDGVSFLATGEVSPDRRFVRLKLTEKSQALQAIDRVKVCDLVTDKEVEAETASVAEAALTKVHEIPDGGMILVAVQYRPRSVQANHHWWVLRIEVRLYIEEEERERQRLQVR